MKFTPALKTLISPKLHASDGGETDRLTGAINQPSFCGREVRAFLWATPCGRVNSSVDAEGPRRAGSVVYPQPLLRSCEALCSQAKTHSWTARTPPPRALLRHLQPHHPRPLGSPRQSRLLTPPCIPSGLLGSAGHPGLTQVARP